MAGIGCGNLRYTTERAECSVEIPFEDAFMVSFCCGFGDCSSAGIPVTPILRSAKPTDAGPQGIFLQWSNRTLIEPLAVGLAPDSAPQQSVHHERHRRQVCRGYREETYQAAKEPYFATFETPIVSGSVAANPDGSPITITYDQSVSESISFDTSIGDPFGVISVSVGFSFENTNSTGVQIEVPAAPGQSGRVGFTPVYQCTGGTLETCGGARTPEQKCRTPYMLNGQVQGDHVLVFT